MPRSFNPSEEAASSSFETLPVGDYAVRVKELEKKKGAADDYLNVTLVVLAKKDKDGAFVPYPGNRQLWDILSYSPKAMGKLGRAFLAVGHPQPPRDLDDMAEMRNEVFEGRTAVVRVKHEEYRGSPSAKVQDWSGVPPDLKATFPDYPPQGGQGASPRSFNPAGNAPPPVSRVAGPPPEFDDGDIPF